MTEAMAKSKGGNTVDLVAGLEDVYYVYMCNLKPWLSVNRNSVTGTMN